MEIERIFRPNKYFLFFCVLLIIIWVALKSVGTMVIVDAARDVGDHIFNWQWNRLGWESQTKVTNVKVIKKTDLEAIVDVQGKQTMTPLNDRHGTVQVDKFAARLLFYRSNNNWILGQVELE